jgi:hypothetical protein
MLYDKDSVPYRPHPQSGRKNSGDFAVKGALPLSASKWMKVFQ